MSNQKQRQVQQQRREQQYQALEKQHQLNTEIRRVFTLSRVTLAVRRGLQVMGHHGQ